MRRSAPVPGAERVQGGERRSSGTNHRGWVVLRGVYRVFSLRSDLVALCAKRPRRALRVSRDGRIRCGERKKRAGLAVSCRPATGTEGENFWRVGSSPPKEGHKIG